MQETLRVKVGQDTYHFHKVEMPDPPEWFVQMANALNSVEVVAIDQRNGVITCRSRK